MNKIGVVELEATNYFYDEPVTGTVTKYTMDQACRTCSMFFNNSSNTSKLFSIFDEKVNGAISLENDCNFQDIVDELILLNLKIEKDDNLPQQICTECIQQLLHIHKFRVRCQESQTTLKEYFSNKVRSLEYCSSENEEERSTSETKENSHNQMNDLASNHFSESDAAVISEDDIKKFEEVLVENIDKNILGIVNEEKDMESISSSLLLPVPPSLATEIIKCNKCNKFSYVSRLKIDNKICSNLIRRDKKHIAKNIGYFCFYCDKIFETKIN